MRAPRYPRGVLTDIAEPLGMLDYRARIYAWPEGDLPIPADADGFRSLDVGKSRYGAYHLRMSAHNLALFGQLYLAQGVWKGRQIVPADWIGNRIAPDTFSAHVWFLHVRSFSLAGLATNPQRSMTASTDTPSTQPAIPYQASTKSGVLRIGMKPS